MWLPRNFRIMFQHISGLQEHASKMDPDTKLGLAKTKFEKLIKVAEKDSVKIQC